MAEPGPALAGQFEDLEQQQDASWLGMWVFLLTEVMFFGGMFAGYAVYRAAYPAAFGDASRHLDLPLGAINTAVLICSSLTMALAVHHAQRGARRHLTAFLVLTLLLGVTFLGIKAVEYTHKFEQHLVPGRSFLYEEGTARHAELFFVFYFALTGMHGLHMVIGVGLLAVLAVRAWRGRLAPPRVAPVELSGLYWHFVDIVWIFLFPLLYLISRT